MEATLAKTLRRLSEANNKLQTLREQFTDELTFEVSVESYAADPISALSLGTNRPEVNLLAIKALQQEIGQLKIRIQLTNVHTQVTYDGENCSIAELLLLLHDFKAQLGLVKTLCSRGRGAKHYSGLYHQDEQVKNLPDYDVDKMREERDCLISEINKLDLFIQQTNFNTELIQ